MYSIASRLTFLELEGFRQEMIRHRGPKPIFILVGNKCDKEYQREVSKEEGIALAQSYECDFLETSAKTAINLTRLFTDIVRLMRIEYGNGPDGGTKAVAGRLVKSRKRVKCIVM